MTSPDKQTDQSADGPILLWLRRDLRLADHPALDAAAATGRPVIPAFILDPVAEAYGAAPLWRLGAGLDSLAGRLSRAGSRLILRRGPALSVLRALTAETGASAVWWTRLYDPDAVARDTAVKAALKSDGIAARSFPGHLLFEPMAVETGQGGPYRVYTPFWRAVKDRDVAAPAPAPKALRPPATWPASDRLDDWRTGAAMRRGAAIVARHAVVGEDAARTRLADFIDQRIDAYKRRRDYPAESATSGLSENLAWGEIGPRTIWHEGMRARQQGAAGAEHFLKEVVWREFAWHLIHHTPEIATRNWRADWDDFPWRGDNPDAERWRRGMTGEPMVDAAMRQMYVTGTMHNRARMIAASYLTKHLMTDWRVGLDWFRDCLTDWDPASNAMGWQWVAGSGPDAAPYFRIFNPATQGDTWDADMTYRRRYIAELSAGSMPDGPVPRDALDFFAAVPESWQMEVSQRYPDPVIALGAGRERALAAYAGRSGAVGGPVGGAVVGPVGGAVAVEGAVEGARSAARTARP